MKNQVRQRKPIPFSWRSWDVMMKKWSLRSVRVSFSWERNGEDSEQSQKFEGKTEKVFKNCLWNAKHVFFATDISRQGHPPKHFKPKDLKNLKKLYLKRKTRVFRNWNKLPGQATKTLKVKIVNKFSKCFLRLEGSTREGVASWAAKISMHPS